MNENYLKENGAIVLKEKDGIYRPIKINNLSLVYNFKGKVKEMSEKGRLANILA